MTIKRFDTFTIVCDEPGCNVDFVDQMSSGEYGGFSKGSLIDYWNELQNYESYNDDDQWYTDGKNHWCYDHAGRHRPQPPADGDSVLMFDPTPLPPAMFDIVEES